MTLLPEEKPPSGAPPGAGRLYAAFDRAWRIIARPHSEWDRIAAEPMTLEKMFRDYAMLLAVIPPVCVFFGRLFAGDTGGRNFWVVSDVMVYVAVAIASYFLSLCVVAAAALAAEQLAPVFGGGTDRNRAFRLAVFSATAAWAAGVFALLGPLGRALAVAGLYSLYLFYLGAPKLAGIPREKAGIFTVAVAAVTAFAILLASRIVDAFWY